MQKTSSLFESWNKQKQFLEFRKNKPKRVKSWEIWIAQVGVNLGSEISKDGDFSRPVLVISNFLWWDIVWVIPLTTHYNTNFSQFLYPIKNWKKFGLHRESFLCLNQFKTMSTKRLTRQLNGRKNQGKQVPLIPHWELEKIKDEIYMKILQKKNP